MSDLINPLQSLINQASELPPGKDLVKYTQRIDPSPRRKLRGSVFLLDISLSMNERIHSGERKIDVLRQALNRSLEQEEAIYCFSTLCFEVPSFQAIPEPQGGTALHTAIQTITPLKPQKTLVVSDGKPDDEKQALAAARKLSGIINTLFIGDDSDTTAINFMKSLARLGCGYSQVCDLTKNNAAQLKAAIRLLSGSPN